MKSTTELFYLLTPLEGTDFVLTKHGTLLCGIELAGMDAGGLGNRDFQMVANIIANAYESLPGNIVITQYYEHFSGVNIHFRERVHPVSNFLSQRRKEFLNQLNMAGSKIIVTLEVLPDENLCNPGVFSTLRHLMQSVGSQKSQTILRHILSSTFSFDKHYVYLKKEIIRQQDILNSSVELFRKLLSLLCISKVMATNELWAHGRFLASGIARRLQNPDRDNYPASHWNYHLSSAGLIEPVQIKEGEQFIKVGDAETRYIQIASIRSLGNPVADGCFALRPDAPTRLAGNYIIMNRWHPMGEFKRQSLFQGKRNEIERQKLRITDFLHGNEEKSILEQQAIESVKDKALLDELQQAENLQQRWGMFSCRVMVFGKNADEALKQKGAMDTALSLVKVSAVWERPGLLDAFKAMQIGCPAVGYRNIPMNTRQVGAAALLYQSSRGQPVVKDLHGEEAQYIMLSEDGKPFHFSSFIGRRSMILGVGGTATGKSHFKKTLAMHYMKYGGLYRSIGIDDGDENLKDVFVGDVSVFRLGEKDQINPYVNFTTYADTDKSDNRRALAEHISKLMQLFLKANDDPSLRQLEKGEQEELDRKIIQTFDLHDHDLRSLTGLVAQLGKSMKMKFQRYVHDVQGGTHHGRYAHVWGGYQDSIGRMDKKIAVFNLQEIQNTENMLLPVLQELTYRITSSFLNPDWLHVPKLLDIDEAHIPLKLPGMADYLVNGMRTWGKKFASIALWTQSPEELERVEGWDAMRTAFTTLVFFASKSFDKVLYKRIFNLTDGEADAISHLVPQLDAYIIQREIGVSKKVRITTEPEQNVLNTSHPLEVTLRNSLIKEFGFEEGMRLAVKEITALRSKPSDVFMNAEKID